MIINRQLKELELLSQTVKNSEYEAFLNSFMHEISRSEIVGIASGRMGFSLRAFIMRLAHMRFKAFMIGDTNLPSIKKNTKVIINSSSGSTKSLVLFAKVAKEHGAELFLVTGNPLSPIGHLSDHILSYGNISSSQIMKSLYEQFTLLLFDSLALDLSSRMKLDEDFMMRNHSVLE
jgi:6-phospho-3-hexuloisomerase